MTAPTWPGDLPTDQPAGQVDGPAGRPAGGSGGAGTSRRRAAGRPTRARTRQELRRARLVTRLAAAATPGLRVSAAADYVRASLVDLPPARSQQVGADAVALLIGLVDQAMKEEEVRSR